MFRYIALVWNTSSPEECDAANTLRPRLHACFPSWKTVFDKPGLFVSCPRIVQGTARVIGLDSTCGVVLGTLFRSQYERPKGGTTHVTALGAEATRALLHTHGRSVISEYWGSYVLFLRDVDRDRILVLRSPMGRLQCFQLSYQGVSLLFSAPEDCAALHLVRFSINWDCIRAQAVRGDYLAHETGIREISTIESGECLQFGRGRMSRSTYWAPSLVVQSDTVQSFAQAVASLRSTTQSCVSAWASLHNRILHTLSGGLDSSIVLACLSQAPTEPSIICVNNYSIGSGDERAFARSMAERHNVELLEHERDRHVDLRIFLDCARTARPVLHFSACDSEPTNTRLATAHNATAIFDGELGDNVFGHGVRTEVVSEYISRHRLGLALLRVATDYARLRRVTVWTALYRGFRDAVMRSKPAYWSGWRYAQQTLSPHLLGANLFSEDAAREYERTMPRFIHPWLYDVQNVPLGKLQLIYAMLVVTSTAYEPPFSRADDPPDVSPLSSQPLVELALRTPTHFHISGAFDRSVARHAFAQELTDLVLNRGMAKTGPEHWLRDLVLQNRLFLREIFLDGILVRQGILDRRKLETALSGEVAKLSAHVTDIIVELYIEAWLRRWSELEMRAAA